MVTGQTVPIVTGDYELTGKSRGRALLSARSAEPRESIIGALAGGREGAAIGAGAGSETITKGVQVKVPSETLIEFTLQHDVSIPTLRK